MRSKKYSSVQPMHGWPDWMGKLTPPFHLTMGQGENVSGPLQPTLYRQKHSRAFSSSNTLTNCPASKWARRGQLLWMRVPYAISGRDSRSHSGARSNVRMYMMTAVITSPMGGQPGTLMTVRSVRISRMPTAPVGLGRAAWMEPKYAHEPTARIWEAFSAQWRSMFSTVSPATVQYTPPSLTGTEPLMTRMWGSLIASSRA